MARDRKTPREPKTKPVTIQYRLADEFSWGTQMTLQDACEVALEQEIQGVTISSCAGLRLKEIDEGSLFINWYHKEEGIDAIFGDLTLYSQDETKLLLDKGGFSRSHVEVEQRPAGKGLEYVDSIMYWMIKNNHVFLIQTPSIRSDKFENYLIWLISEKTPAVQSPASFMLLNKFDGSTVPGGLQEIDEIVLGSTLRSEPPTAKSPEGLATVPPGQIPAQLQPTEVDIVDVVNRTSEGMTDVLKNVLSALLGGPGRVESIMSNVPPEAQLKVSVHISYTDRKAKNKTPLRNFERELRHLPEGFMKLKAKDGLEYPDGQVKFHSKDDVRLVGVWSEDGKWVGSMLESKDVARAFVDAYNEMVVKGKIVDHEQSA